MKQGLDYFPLSCHMDDSVRLVEAELGLEGFALIIKLWQDIYQDEGYYKEFNKDVQLLFAREVNISPEALAEFLGVALERGIFNKKLYEKYQILTSKGIQERFLKCTGRRKKIVLKSEYLLADYDGLLNVTELSEGKNCKTEDTACKNQENVCKKEENADNFSQSKVKESKVKESKGKESKNPRPRTKKSEPNFSDDISEYESAQDKNLKAKSRARPYGEYKNVSLTDAQRQALLSEIGADSLSEYIKKVDEYVQETGKRYNDYCLTIRRWYREDKEKKASSGAPPKIVKKSAFCNYNDTNKTDYKKLGDEILKQMLEG